MSTNVSKLIAVGNNLRRARIKYGVGLRELALMIRVSPSALSRIENGKEKPSNRILVEYSDKFRMDVDDLSRALGMLPIDMVNHLVQDPDAAKRVRQEMEVLALEEKAVG